jgi:hypothetical protein
MYRYLGVQIVFQSHGEPLLEKVEKSAGKEFELLDAYNIEY